MLELTFLQDQYYRRGIGRYGREIFHRIIKTTLKSPHYTFHLIGYTDLRTNLELLDFNATEIRQLSESEHIKFHSLGKPIVGNSFWMTPILNLRLYSGRIIPLVKRLRPDLYIAAHFEKGLPSNLVPTAVAVHDAIPLINNKFSSQGKLVNYIKGLYYRKFAWEKVKQAKLIFTSSQTSADDLIKFGGLRADQIKLVHLGISDIFRDPKSHFNQQEINTVLRKYGLLSPNQEVKPYLIYDAGFEGNKNTEMLAMIFTNLVKRLPKMKLVITGGDFAIKDKKFEATNDRSLHFSGLIIRYGSLKSLNPVGKVSEPELAILLANATAYINLSSYEGFGFGPLQAMAAGVPAITSNLSCFPEILGQNALLLDLNDTQQATAQILELLSSDQKLKAIVQKGYNHAANFSWEKTFDQTWKIINNQLKSNPIL